MNYLLDTNIIIGLLREAPMIVEKYLNLPSDSVKAITVATSRSYFRQNWTLEEWQAHPDDIFR